MTCRRKTKRERELIADIKKTFEIMCSHNNCLTCPYYNEPGEDLSCLEKYMLTLCKQANRELKNEVDEDER